MAVESPPVFLQAGSHGAELVRRALYAQLGLRGGIVQSGDLAVTQNGTPNMTVLVATGQVVVPGTQATYAGAYICENRGSMSVNIAAADATNPRYDLIVARVRDAAYSGVDNTFAIEAVTGTPAASPAEPTIPANSWVLARITVAALDTAINTADITDRRTTGTGQFGQAAALGGTIICTSTTRPTAPFEAMKIYETDTDFELTYSGSAWVNTAQLLGWTSTTHTWTQSTSVAHTTNYAKYTKIGRTVTGNVQLTSTTSAAGAANTIITVTAPLAAAAASQIVGSGYLYNATNNGTNTIGNYPFQVYLQNTTTFAFIPTDTTYNVSLGVGFFTEQLQTSDSILFNYRYETAS